jgi:hypothetical protein
LVPIHEARATARLIEIPWAISSSVKSVCAEPFSIDPRRFVVPAI